jgi:hypothetical protein
LKHFGFLGIVLILLSVGKDVQQVLYWPATTRAVAWLHVYRTEENSESSTKNIQSCQPAYPGEDACAVAVA